MTLQRRFDRHLRGFHLPSGPALVAVSGGPDSLALLFLLHHSRVARRLRLSVAHVDHGIHPESARVARSVEQAAHRLGLSFAGKRLELGRAATETKAREARYRWLVEEAERAGARLIFTAHHRDDQIETIVMRLLKGSGPAGLAGIPSRRGRLVRPLLPFRREELAAFLHEQGVNAWQDPANSDPRHERSQVRTELLPRLRERFPGIEESLLEMGRLAAAERTAWDALLESLPELDLTRDGDGVSVAATPLRGYDSGVLRGLLAALGRRVGYQVGPARAGRIERLLAGGQSGAVAELGSGGAAELSFGRLRLFRGDRHLTWEPLVVSGGTGRKSAGGWRIGWSSEPAPVRLERMGSTNWFAPGKYLVRPWRPGDRIRPLGGVGRRLVVRCMQDAKIASGRRASWPVVEKDGTVVWVPGVSRSAEVVPAPGTRALRIDAAHR